MIIKNSALKLLSVLGASCRTLGEKKVRNICYIHKCAQKGEDMEVADFLDNFPQGTMVYKLLEPFAKKNGNKEIDSDTVIKFFGGAEHFLLASEQVSDWEALAKKPLDQKFKDNFVFAHMLIPMEITRKLPVISGKYLVAGRKIYARGLVAHPTVFPNFYRDLEVGREYLVHYATITCPADNKISSWIRKEHIKSAEFFEVLDRIQENGGIDYRKFWSLKEWTEDMIEQCGL